VCTLAIAWQCLPETPIAVAANRDERFDRPASAPTTYRETPLVIAPRDETAGGTWIGYNEFGLFVGITNRWVDRDGVRSRGTLVAECLSYNTVDEASSFVVDTVGEHHYAGFNLVLADATDAILFEYDGSLHKTTFDPGVHVVVNVGADGSQFESPSHPDRGAAQAAAAAIVRDELAVNKDETADAWLERAGAVLGDHEFAVCIHGDGFGTRSSSLISLQTDGDRIRDKYLFASGPPCQTTFEPISETDRLY